MSLDDFLRCPVDGCEMRVVKGNYLIRNRCRDHGGNPELPQFRDADPWGDYSEAPPPASSPAVPAIHLGLIED